jgi:hypothetical protein
LNQVIFDFFFLSTTLVAQEFEKGSTDKGRLVFKFSKKNHDKFSDLAEWLKSQIKDIRTVECVNLFHCLDQRCSSLCPHSGKGATAIWEGADRMAGGRGSESQKRVGALITLRHAARSSVTPDLHNEEDSQLLPSRPVPKPA